MDQLSFQLGSIEEAIATLEEFRSQGASKMPLWKLAWQISGKVMPKSCVHLEQLKNLSLFVILNYYV